jgi:serine/threonine protein kinase
MISFLSIIISKLYRLTHTQIDRYTHGYLFTTGSTQYLLYTYPHSSLANYMYLQLERIALVENELFVFFRYVEKTLFDLINPGNDPSGGRALPPELTRRYLYQVLQAVEYCHERGVLHRNLKPKHFLVGSSDADKHPVLVKDEDRLYEDVSSFYASSSMMMAAHDYRDLHGGAPSTTATTDVKNNVAQMAATSASSLSSYSALCGTTTTTTPGTHSNEKLSSAAEATAAAATTAASMSTSIKISDFALVRSTSIPLRNFTTEVVTLWYRAPEVLMGGQYFAAVDVWSVGCVFGEMVLGE